MNNKNILIGGLLAVILVMAVGYAVFSTTLTVNGTANITSSWNVGYDTTKTSGTGVITTTGTASAGTITYDSAQAATIAPSLVAPGDSVTYTLTVKNTGSLAATLGTPTITNPTGCTVSGLTCTSTSGNIKFTVTAPASSSLAASTGTTTFTVKAEYVNKTVSSATTESATITVNLVATQA